MPTCPCCGDELSPSAELSELCPQCANVMADSESSADQAQPLPKLPQPYPLTKTLIAVNVGVFVLTKAIHHFWTQSTSRTWGADWGPLTLGGQWWRLMSSTFLHSDVAHLLGNLLALWILGKRAEQVFGRWTLLLIYLYCGVAGGLVSLAAHPEIISLGASGATFGLAGALISAYALKGFALSHRARWKLLVLILWTGADIYPYAGDLTVDNAAHAGGLIMGLITGLVLSSRLTETIAQRRWVFSGMAAALLLGAVLVYHYNGYVVHLDAAENAFDTGRTEDALRELDFVLQRKPDSWLANTLAANVYLKKHDYTRAEAAARRALAADQESEYAIYLLGAAEMATGRCKEARDMALSQVVKHKENPPREALLLLVANCNALDAVAAGDRYLKDQQFDKAIQAYRDALESDPGNPLAQLGLASALEMQKAAEAAKQHR